MSLRLADARRRARNFLSDKPAIFLPLRRLRGFSDSTVDRDTELVIEGFPRSGNSFAEAAFRLSQSRDIKIAHHSHAAAQVIRAAHWKIPCLVVIREPLESARSLIMFRNDTFDPSRALFEYELFHNAILNVRYALVLARFETVTSDFGSVVDVINARFQTRFIRFEHTKENAMAAFDLIDELSKQRGTLKSGVVAYSPRAEEQSKVDRQRKKEEVNIHLRAAATAGMADGAVAIYKKLERIADV
jgi:hypothetical protein